jgi:lipoprotein NlpI
VARQQCQSASGEIYAAERTPVFFIHKVPVEVVPRLEALVASNGVAPEEKAKAHFFRGLLRGQTANYAGAIEDFSAVLADPAAAVGQRNEALFFRAIAHGITGDLRKELADLNPAARVFRIMASGHSGGIKETIDKFSAILGRTDIPPEQRAAVLYLRGLAHGRHL